VEGPAPLSFVFAEPIVTGRLTLRLMTPADLYDVHAYQGREDVCRYLLHEPRSREDLAPRIAEWEAATRIAEDHDYLQLAIQLDEHPTRRVIGHMYLKLASAENLQGEIGWTLHPDFFGRGYATEASHAVLDLAFTTIGLHRMRAELDPRNAASIALCLRLGMRHEATFRQDLWFKGEWADTGIYAILAEEWAAQKSNPGSE
jgi:RimJ/RimL family protein N-acetyltransferase